MWQKIGFQVATLEASVTHSVPTLHSFDDNVRILAANLRELHYAHMALSSGVNGTTAPTTNDAVSACSSFVLIDCPLFRVGHIWGGGVVWGGGGSPKHGMRRLQRYFGLPGVARRYC